MRFFPLLLFAILAVACADRFGALPEDQRSSGRVEVSSSGKRVSSPSSSSSAGSLSSAGVPGECPNLEADHNLTDCRDNQVYRFDTLGSQIWMTENLRYVPQAGWGGCYGDSIELCNTMGRLYDWEAALHSCPFGWRLPGLQDWDMLSEHLGGDPVAGAAMRFPNAFGARPTGYRFAGNFHFGAENAYWWTSDEYDSLYASYRYLLENSDTLYEDGHFRENGLAVRCMKNVQSSSSQEYSSSSITCGEDYQGISLGMIVDARDQQSYATVRICRQEWLAENLNYSANGTLGVCENTELCDDGWGRWYSWEDVVGASWVEMYKEVEMPQAFPGICPEDWHIPDNGDLSVLFAFMMQEQENYTGDADALFLGVGKYLKAEVTNLDFWNDPEMNAGNPYGFSALPAGGVWSATEDLLQERDAAIWYVKQLEGGGAGGQGIVYQATGMRLRDESAFVDHFWGTRSHALSVRCVRTVLTQ